jgi:hypothetical protein
VKVDYANSTDREPSAAESIFTGSFQVTRLIYKIQFTITSDSRNFVDYAFAQNLSLLRDPQLSAHLSDALPLRHVHFRLPKHPDNLLNSKTIPLHPDLLSASDSAITLTQNLDQFWGVR